jgi:hypothetical protein
MLVAHLDAQPASLTFLFVYNDHSRLHKSNQLYAKNGNGQQASELEIVDDKKWCIGAKGAAGASPILPHTIAVGQ